MGGKDFILVDETADVEDAPTGVVAARLRIPGPEVLGLLAADRPRAVHDELLERVVAKTKALTVGDVRDRSTTSAPSSTRGRRRRSSSTSRSARRKAGSWPGGKAGPKQGYFVMPTVVDGVRPSARLACEEIFGPVLAVLKVRASRRGSRSPTARVRPDGRALLARPRAPAARQARALRRQPLPEPQVHRRARRRPSLRRLQHVRHGLQGRRPRVPVPLHPAEVDFGETVGFERRNT